jgi:O-succinylbenzoic acid--CoA ligase
VATTPLTPYDDAFWCDARAIAMRSALEKSETPVWLKEQVAEGLVFFRTSGSEGRPKWIGLSRAALLASARAVNSFLGVTGSDVWLRVLPWHHVAGFGVEARAWVAGARLIRDEGRWSPARFVATCDRERATLTSLVPTQVFDLVRSESRPPPSLRAAVVGGGALRPVLWERGRELGWPILTSYGLTEAASQVATLRAGEADPTRLTLLPHWQAEVSGDGCLQLRGSALATCYLREEADGRWCRDDIGSQLTTADRVTLAAAVDGVTLRFLGRRGRTVKILGELVDLNALEAILTDAACELGVFGLVRMRSEPDERAGHRLVLECLNKEVGDAVVALINPRLPSYSRFAEVRVVADLRLSDLGKPVL